MRPGDAFLTTAQGNWLYESDHCPKACDRGPVLLQDHHLRQKITHFDHERIPERVVHARGAAARRLPAYAAPAAKVTEAAFLGDGVETPVFTEPQRSSGLLTSP
jgi:catalase